MLNPLSPHTATSSAGGNCVVAMWRPGSPKYPGRVHIYDTKKGGVRPGSPFFEVTEEEWHALLATIRRDPRLAGANCAPYAGDTIDLPTGACVQVLVEVTPEGETVVTWEHSRNRTIHGWTEGEIKAFLEGVNAGEFDLPPADLRPHQDEFVLVA